MGDRIETSIAIDQTLYDQAEQLAQHMGVPRSRLVEMALEQFIRDSVGQTSPADEHVQPETNQQVIHQGDVYWVQPDDVDGQGAGIRHPHVVIQDDALNHSRILTVVACALTSNVGRASLPGNVLLDAGEANLLKPSVVEASKVSTVDKARLGDYIGTLNAARVQQILAGLRFLQRGFFERD